MGHRTTWELRGQRAAVNGLTEADCPYKRESAAKACWLRGYRREVEDMEAWLDDFEPGWREHLARMT